MLHLPNLDLYRTILEACPTCAQLDVLLGTWGEGEGCLIEWADQDVPNLWGWEGTNLLKCWGKRFHQGCICFVNSHGGNEIVNWCLCTILELSKTKWEMDNIQIGDQISSSITQKHSMPPIQLMIKYTIQQIVLWVYTRMNHWSLCMDVWLLNDMSFLSIIPIKTNAWGN